MRWCAGCLPWSEDRGSHRMDAIQRRPPLWSVAAGVLHRQSKPHHMGVELGGARWGGILIKFGDRGRLWWRTWRVAETKRLRRLLPWCPVLGYHTSCTTFMWLTPFWRYDYLLGTIASSHTLGARGK